LRTFHKPWRWQEQEHAAAAPPRSGLRWTLGKLERLSLYKRDTRARRRLAARKKNELIQVGHASRLRQRRDHNLHRSRNLVSGRGKILVPAMRLAAAKQLPRTSHRLSLLAFTGTMRGSRDADRCRLLGDLGPENTRAATRCACLV